MRDSTYITVNLEGSREIEHQSLAGWYQAIKAVQALYPEWTSMVVTITKDISATYPTVIPRSNNNESGTP